uniref:Potassium two pore domain channel subfamily K member 4 n=1 Tax=Seriola lalandi dorsalis TaxID=1841481 RepID=A0A3B4Y025_SERLL
FTSQKDRSWKGEGFTELSPPTSSSGNSRPSALPLQGRGVDRVKMRYTTLLALLTGVMLYLVMGALVFRTLEFPKESSAFEDLLKAKQNFLGNNSCVTELDFHNLLKEVVSAVDAGLDVSSLPANFTSRWDLASAFFFCGTIITTIGFGNLSPRTWYGQLFCVCYALVGIPMFGILLAGVGDHMGTVLRRAVAKIETLFLKRKVRPTTVRVISAVLSILIGCLIFLAVPTVVFQKMEEWSFLESLYFVVITLTTVGFGDFVPVGGPESGSFLKPLVWLWIVFGLAYFASILTMIGNWLRVLSKRTRAEVRDICLNLNSNITYASLLNLNRHSSIGRKLTGNYSDNYQPNVSCFQLLKCDNFLLFLLTILIILISFQSFYGSDYWLAKISYLKVSAKNDLHVTQLQQ